jgi:hypothetical protein
MQTFTNTPALLSYPDWSKSLGVYSDNSQAKYLEYLTDWYKSYSLDQKSIDNNNKIKDQYIQLIKDLNFLFNADERDLFLSDIDYNNTDDLIYIIPYLAHKLKEITQIIAAKREELKNSKFKHGMIGSNLGLEKILYEYVLKNFTKKDYSYTRVPISPLTSFFPELSSISNDFYIEIEELYDTENYHDSDPTVSISNYEPLSAINDYYPFDSLTDDDINNLISSRIIPRIVPTPLSKIFNEYLTSVPTLSTTTLSALSAEYTAKTFNIIAANQKYLGESVYGLTAVRVSELNAPDYTISLNLQQGNNYFYWPSGDKVADDSQIGNIFKPILINNSNFVNNHPVSGSSYLDSDLIFTDKNGILEGAWLQGRRIIQTKDTMSINLVAKDNRSFVFPFVGFNINSKDLSFKSYSLNDSNYILYQTLDKSIKQNILNTYYSNHLPSSAVNDMYLNQTKLIDAGAFAGKFSDESDTLVKTPSANQQTIWSDELLGNVEKSFLFKFNKTDIPISTGFNNILWPLMNYSDGQGSVKNLSLTLDDKTCLPIMLGNTSPAQSMLGCTAGNNFNTSDVIYKVSDNAGNNAIEAAWLGAGNISQLDYTQHIIPVYATSAVNCAEYIDGPIQPSLSFIAQPGEYTSFIWMDKDTPADDVFLYREHAANCPYGQSYPHNFFVNQDYQNPTPLNSGDSFPLTKTPCNCRSIYYSPLGHEGDTFDSYNTMGDLLFADPKGLGADFTVNSWVDTRNFDPHHSPQFSFYQLDGTMDKDVGYGLGKWMTGNGHRMILKTGRRYTYYRSPLRKGVDNNITVPYLITNYAYQNISVNCPSGYAPRIDLVVLIDNSRTETYALDTSKTMAASFCEYALNTNSDILISVISFAEKGLLLNYLTNNKNSVLSHISGIQPTTSSPEWLTDIYGALILANNVLSVNKPLNNNCDITDTTSLCKGLADRILNFSNIPTITNCPRSNAAKKIIIFSDGQETVNIGKAIPIAEKIKASGVEIISMDLGYYSDQNDLMETIANDGYYYNVQNYILYGDVNLDSFNRSISLSLLGCFPSIPTWCKATKNSAGAWVENYIVSDMELKPGDYLVYVHRGKVSYVGQNPNVSFTIPTISFTVNLKLDGWDYSTSTFNLSAAGADYGARPFWAKTLTNSASTFGFGGQITYYDDYVLVHQPDISDMVLNNGCYIQYSSMGNRNVNWQEHLTFNVTLTTQQWNKLIIDKNYSNLSFAFNSDNLYDLIISQSHEPSDLTLESYSSFKPVKYNYFVRNSAFNFTQDLYYINRCETSFVTFTTASVLEAVTPHLNLDNIHYPTVATIDFPSNTVSETQLGHYLLPDRLGVPYYLGRGYTMNVDPNKLSYIDSVSAERLFLDINKYASRNRGLTKNDQNSPVSITDIDNRWLFEPYSTGSKSGIINNTKNNQKLVPYQTNYEINQNNEIGLCYQKDNFEFWDVNYYNQWSDELNYPLSFRKELILSSYFNRVESLLTNKGVTTQWRTDIFGNNYGLFKDYDLPETYHIKTERGVNTISEGYIPLSVESAEIG